MKARFLVGFICLISSTYVWAQPGTGYLRGGIGPAFTQDTDFEEFATEPVGGAELEFDTGIHFDFAAGMRFNEWLGAELESGIIFNEVRGVGIPSSGDLSVSQFPILANLIAEVPTGTRLRPYLGAGLGGSVSILDVDDFTVGGTTADGTFSDFVFAYHAFAGLRFDIHPSMSFGVGYRFFHADATRWEPDVTFGTTGDIKADRIESHMVTLTFTFSF